MPAAKPILSNPYEEPARHYATNFIARIPRPDGRHASLVLEITGMERDKPEKMWFVENRWLSAVDAVAARHGRDTWDFLGIAGPAQIADIERLILAQIQRGHHPTPVPPLMR